MSIICLLEVKRKPLKDHKQSISDMLISMFKRSPSYILLIRLKGTNWKEQLSLIQIMLKLRNLGSRQNKIKRTYLSIGCRKWKRWRCHRKCPGLGFEHRLYGVLDERLVEKQVSVKRWKVGANKSLEINVWPIEPALPCRDTRMVVVAQPRRTL